MGLLISKFDETTVFQKGLTWILAL